MPAFTFTASSAANTLSIAGHGLLTGDGPIAVRGVDGAALPSPLLEQVDYWVIRVDDNTIRLATSSGAANAGTFIDLATDGSGTLVLEIGLPYRRPITYVERVSQVRARDFNAIFDSWKSLHAMLTGQAQSVWTAARLNMSLSAQMIRASVGITGGVPEAPVRLAAPLGINITGGDLAHGERVISIPAAAFSVRAGNGGFASVTVGGRSWDVLTFGTGGNGLLWAPLPFLRQGDRILEVAFRVLSLTGSGGAGSITLAETTHAAGRVAAAAAVTPLIPSNSVLGDSASFKLSSLTRDVGSDSMFDIAIANADTAGVAGLIGAIVKISHP